MVGTRRRKTLEGGREEGLGPHQEIAEGCKGAVLRRIRLHPERRIRCPVFVSSPEARERMERISGPTDFRAGRVETHETKEEKVIAAGPLQGSLVFQTWR